MVSVTIKAPAKINLFLRIVGKRPDGYHDLVSLMCPVALYDILTLTFGGDKVSITCDHQMVPQDESNIAAIAALHFYDAAFNGKIPPSGGVAIHIQKKIPVGAGLGGGSSDAAAVLSVLNDHFGGPIANSALMDLGVRLGADVPFFLFGKPAVAMGIGDRLVPFAHLLPWTALMVYPDLAVSTQWVYKNLTLRLTKVEKNLRNFHFDGRFFDIGTQLANDLEAVTASAFPVINEIKRLLVKNGAAGALMAGSGSTVFGLFEDAQRAEFACKALQNNHRSKKWTLYVADLLT